MAPSKFTAEVRAAYVELLRAGLGRHQSARQVGVNARYVSSLRKADAEFREACEGAEEEAVEPVERALYEAALRGEPWAVKLWLTHRGKEWAEAPVGVKVEVSGAVGVGVAVEAGPALVRIAELAAALGDRKAALALEAGPLVLDAESSEVGGG